MTAPAPPSGVSPLKIGGIGLIGVAVASAVIGLVAWGTGGDGQSTEEAASAASSISASAEPTAGATAGEGLPLPPLASSAPSAGATAAGDAAAAGAVPGVDGAVAGADGTVPGAAGGVPGAAGGAAGSGPAAAAGGAGGFGGGAGGGTAVTRLPLRVYNNSTVEGLAANASEQFQSAGWQVAFTGNFSGQPYVPTSTVYYRAGEEAAARQLADAFGLTLQPRSASSVPDSSPGLLVVLTRDFKTK